MNIEPTKQQYKTLNKSNHWYKTGYKQVFEISGGAGTGKTTIVYMLIQQLGLKPDEVLFMAYVGKATLALARKGNFAQTIHTSIYNLVEVPLEDDNGNIRYSAGRPIMVPSFIKKESLDPKIKLLVIDEAGMVNEDIAKDILSFGLPVITLGDLNQLPPVFGDSYFLQNPDAILTEPMRQALDSPIISLAQDILNNRYLRFGQYGKNTYIIKREAITEKMLTKSDLVICGKNKTKELMNHHVRHNILGITKDRPVVGDKMICRQNNWKIPPLDGNIYLINGLIGYVTDVDLESFNKRSIKMDFRPEFMDSHKFNNIEIDYKYLMNPTDKTYRFLNKFEYAYAITCHVAQGSEANHVFVYNESMGDREYMKAWLYTAVTRAKEGLILSL